MRSSQGSTKNRVAIRRRIPIGLISTGGISVEPSMRSRAKRAIQMNAETQASRQVPHTSWCSRPCPVLERASDEQSPGATRPKITLCPWTPSAVSRARSASNETRKKAVDARGNRQHPGARGARTETGPCAPNSPRTSLEGGSSHVHNWGKPAEPLALVDARDAPRAAGPKEACLRNTRGGSVRE